MATIYEYCARLVAKLRLSEAELMSLSAGIES